MFKLLEVVRGIGTDICMDYDTEDLVTKPVHNVSDNVV